MIHHVSIPARDPRRVADVLAELLKGRAYPFPPVPGAYMAVSGDTHGSMIEVYPESVVLEPGTADDAFRVVDAGKAGATAPRSVPFHLFISVPRERAEIERIGRREGWQTTFAGRGAPGQPPVFHVIEVWIENKLMLELAAPSMVRPYVDTIQFEVLDRMFAEACDDQEVKARAVALSVTG